MQSTDATVVPFEMIAQRKQTKLWNEFSGCCQINLTAQHFDPSSELQTVCELAQ